MGLEDDIKKAFEESIGGESIQTQKLASDLTNAIVKWVQAQTFTVTELEMSQTLTNVQGIPNAGGPVTIPLIPITTAISDTGQKTANLKAGGKIESMKSKVQLKNVTRS
tara:strand:- start:118 stop:444 length:327 start_codon:yes stop_codon:yes gene_type:complete